MSARVKFHSQNSPPGIGHPCHAHCPIPCHDNREIVPWGKGLHVWEWTSTRFFQLPFFVEPDWTILHQ